MAPGDVRVLEDAGRRFEDGTVLRVRVLAVPESEKFPDGVKYRLHYGTDSGETLVRYDNSHGDHERHTSEDATTSTSFPATTPSRSDSGTKSNSSVTNGPRSNHDAEHTHRDR